MPEVDCVYRITADNLPPDCTLIGGKALGLRAIHQAGCPELACAVVTTAIFKELAAELSLDADAAAIDRCLARGDEERALEISSRLRKKIAAHRLSGSHLSGILAAAHELTDNCEYRTFAVRSSGTCEDQHDHSFAGCFASALNVSPDDLVPAILACYASLYSTTSLLYSARNSIAVTSLSMAIVLQPAVPATAAGVGFSTDPRSGCDATLIIEACPGLGTSLVSGQVTPDRFVVGKAGLAPVTRQLSRVKSVRTVFADKGGTADLDCKQEANGYCIGWGDVREVGKWMELLEQRQGSPVDIEWLKDDKGAIRIVQVRPLKRMPAKRLQQERLLLSDDNSPIVTGEPITARIARGRVRWLGGETGDRAARPGEVILARRLDVDCFRNVREAEAVVACEGGYTSHIAIILRENGIPAIFAAGSDAEKLRDGDLVTVDCTGPAGKVYSGSVPGCVREIDYSSIYRPCTRTHVVTSSYDRLHDILRLPLSGIGLVRMEFLIANEIGIHPLALCAFDAGELADGPLKAEIKRAIAGFETATAWYIETLCNAVCQFAVACPHHVVNVRLPDLISNDYLALAGGGEYEERGEANPMLGWRGTTKLISREYRAAFELDCRALHTAICARGFHNINVMLPFCRTPEDGAQALSFMRGCGLQTVRIGMMVEIPSNIVLADEFAKIFDFFLVGPMDLTQFAYAADRKSTRLGHYNNQTAATREMVKVFLSKISGMGKDVFIGGWPLFQHYKEYAAIKSNNRIMLVELPDRLIELFESLRHLESQLSVQQSGAS